MVEPSVRGTPGKGRGRGRGRGSRGRGRGGHADVRSVPHIPPVAAPDAAGLAPVADSPAVPSAPVVGATAAAATALAQEADDEEVCFICAEPIVLYSVPPCNHRVCHICSMRLRALWKKRDCTFCKAEAANVIFTPDATASYGEFAPSALPYKDEKLGIYFEHEHDYENTIALLRFNCPISHCGVMSGGWADLKTHVKRTHSRLLCDLCIKHKKIFSHEHAVYTAASLQEHLSDEHRYCEYCRQHFYSEDELWVHMRDRHEQCHICKSRSEEERWRYFRDYPMLEQHFHREHYLCPAKSCLEKKFVVFENQMELQVHQVQEHGSTLSSRERREALRVDANFYEEPNEEPSSRRRRKGRGDGSLLQEPTNAHIAPSRRAQFGHALTEPEGGPEQQQSEKYWSTVLAVLNDSQIKLTACRGALQAYRASELGVQDVLKTIMNVTGEGTQEFDVGTTDLVIQSLAEILHHTEKRAELLQAWQAVKGQQTRFPAPSASSSRGVPELKTVASGNNRVWENVARAAANTPRGANHFPRLGAPSRGTPGIPGSAAHVANAARRTQSTTTPWSPAAFPTLGGAPAPRAAPTPHAVAVSRGSAAPRAAMQANQFPRLPTNAGVAERQSEKRQLLGRTAAPVRGWGAAAPAPSLSSSAFPSLGEVSGALPSAPAPPAASTGKQRRKKGVLLSSVSSMHHS